MIVVVKCRESTENANFYVESDGVVNNLLQCVTIVCINYSIKVDSVHTIKLYNKS